MQYSWEAPAPGPRTQEEAVSGTHYRQAGGGLGGNKRPSASQRQRDNTANQEAVEAVLNDNLLALSRRWKCESNYPSGSRLYTGNSHGHIPLSIPNLNKWNELIKKGLASVETVPIKVLRDARVARERAKAKDKVKTAPAQQSMMMPPTPIYYQNYYATASGGGAPALPSIPRAISQPIKPRSSPPYRLGDDDLNIRSYLEWLGLRYPQSSGEFVIACEVLAKEGWGFSDLREITDLNWQGIKIGGGFVRKIKKHLKDWIRKGQVIQSSS